MDIKLIAGVASNGVIGSDGSLPWDYPEDLKHFRETTNGYPMIMGRVTFEDIVDGNGSPLPNRESIVLTSRDDIVCGEYDNVHIVSSVDEAVDVASSFDSCVFIIGGESVYEQFMNVADELILTELHDEFEGDAYFPDFDSDSWNIENVKSKSEFDIRYYK